MQDSFNKSRTFGSCSSDTCSLITQEGQPNDAVNSQGHVSLLEFNGSENHQSPAAMESDQQPSILPLTLGARDLDFSEIHSDRKRKRSLAMDGDISFQETEHVNSPRDVFLDNRSSSLPAKRAKSGTSHLVPDSLSSIPSDRSKLPKEVWDHIFTYLPPITLGKVLCVNKTFYMYLTNSHTYYPNATARQGLLKCLRHNSIWSASRKRFHPGMPRPLKNMNELDMWKLIRGKHCQFCRKSGVPLSLDTLPWERGPAPDNIHVIWPFGIRTCGECLADRTEKEMDLMLSSLPMFLVPAIPFALFTPTLHYVPSVILRSNPFPSDLVITKRYYKPDIDRVKHKFEEVKTLGPATVEEWIKGLEGKGKHGVLDASRWEQWEANGKLQSVGADIFETEERFSRQFPATNTDDVFPSAGLNSGHSTPPENGGLLGANIGSSSSGAPTNGTGLPSRPFSTHAQQPQVPLVMNGIQQPRAERSLREVNEAKALRKSEIERRCSELDPPLMASVLSHMESFSAAIQIPHPLTDRDWEILRPRLLSQREIAERREQERLKQAQLLQARSEERRQQEAHFKETKVSLDREWEETQKPIRDRVALYAEEFINASWCGGASVSKEKCPKFAADVLMHVRNQFYKHIEEEDSLARASGHPVEQDRPNAPPRRKLTLENMKWIFDTKIKPLTERFQKELFLCNGCENNSKLYGFEGVVQHYAAKHTSILSLGSMIVHWRAEWPEKPPFHPNPDAAKALFHAIPHGAITQGSGHTGHRGGTGTYLTGSDYVPQDRTPVFAHQSPGPYVRPSYSTPYPFPHGPYRPPSPGMSQYFPSPQPGYGHPLSQSGYHPSSPYEQHAHTQPMYGSPYLGQAYMNTYAPHEPRPSSSYQAPSYGPPPQSPFTQNCQNTARAPWPSGLPNQTNPTCYAFGAYQDQLDEIAKKAREVWNGTSGIKDLPNSIRAYALIYHLVTAFRDKFSSEPTLALFADGLNNHTQMKPVRNLGGLTCRACKGTNDYQAQSNCDLGRDRRLYTLPALVSHFQSVHIEHVKSTVISGIEAVRLDWKYDMIELPKPTIVASVLHAWCLDDTKLKFIADAFPGFAHASPIPLSQRQSHGYSNTNRSGSVAVGHNDMTSTASSPSHGSSHMVAEPSSRFLRSPIVDIAMTMDSHYGEPDNRSSDIAQSQYYNSQPKSGEKATELTQKLSDKRKPAFNWSHGGQIYRNRKRKAHENDAPCQSTIDSSRFRPSIPEMEDRTSRLYSREQSIKADCLVPARTFCEDDESCGRLTRLINGREDTNRDEDLSAAERFLSDFVPGAQNYQPSRPREALGLDTHSGEQRYDATSFEGHYWRHGLSGDMEDHNVRGGPASKSGNDWVIRKGCTGSTGSTGGFPMVEPARQIHKRTASRLREERSPEAGDARRMRKTAGYQDSRRPQSRFDRYEAQRQGSLRPKSRSPAIRNKNPGEAAYYGEHGPNTRTHQNPLYSGLSHDYYDLPQSEGNTPYTTTARRDHSMYTESLQYVESQYDNPGKYVPARMPTRDIQGGGASHSERALQREQPKLYIESDLEYSRQAIHGHSGQLYRAVEHRPNPQRTSSTFRRHSPLP